MISHTLDLNLAITHTHVVASLRTTNSLTKLLSRADKYLNRLSCTCRWLTW